MFSKSWKIVFLVAAVLVVSALHFLTPIDAIVLHQIYQRLYYLPIIVGAFWFGWRGGLGVALLASLSYVPHIFLHWQHLNYEYALNQYAEIFLFWLIGAVVGALGDANRRERERAEKFSGELQTAYSDLRQTFNQLVQAEKLSALGELSAGIVHEIRNPLGAIKGAVEIMEVELAPDSPRREFAEIAKKEVDRLNKLVEEFIQFARVPKPDKTPTDLNETVKSIRQLIERQAQQQNVSIEEDLTDNLPLLAVDAGQINQVLLNLAINALQTMPAGGTLIFRTFTKENLLFVEVEDTGGGIEEKNLSRVLNPFFTTKEKSLGLGLAIAYKIAVEHHGNLSIRNGRAGAIFSLELTVKQADLTNKR